MITKILEIWDTKSLFYAFLRFFYTYKFKIENIFLIRNAIELEICFKIVDNMF